VRVRDSRSGAARFFQGSQEARQPPVKRPSAGSNPAPGADRCHVAHLGCEPVVDRSRRVRFPYVALQFLLVDPEVVEGPAREAGVSRFESVRPARSRSPVVQRRGHSADNRETKVQLLPGELTWGHSSTGRVPALQAGGRGFDPLWLHHCVRGVCGCMPGFQPGGVGSIPTGRSSHPDTREAQWMSARLRTGRVGVRVSPRVPRTLVPEAQRRSTSFRSWPMKVRLLPGTPRSSLRRGCWDSRTGLISRSHAGSIPASATARG
jgi:hypothetical protein